MIAASGSHVLLLAPVSGPLVGRAVELDRLREAWRRAATGTRQLVLLTGEGGVGKTRLAAEVASEAAAEGATVLFGSWPPGGAEPCEGLVEALGPVAPPGGDRASMFEEIAVRLARMSPVVLVLDDLHRADRTSLLALRHVLDMPGPPAVLIVGAYRETAVDRAHPLAELLSAVHDRPEVERLTVEGLRPEAVGELAGDAELGSRLWRQSQGSPLVVGELLRLGAFDALLPPSFEELVGRRIGRLGEVTGQVLETAAVVGHRFSVPVLAAATGLAGQEVTSAVREAVAAGLVVDDPSRPGAHRFVHHMVREAIERRTPPVRRVRLHLAVGQAQARQGTSPAALAWHFRAAAPVGGSADAVRHSARAGDRAMEMTAWDEAATHYGHALAAAAGVAPGVRVDLLLSLGEAQRLAGEAARARQCFVEAAETARRCGDGARLAGAALALGRLSAVWGADPLPDRLAGEARALLGGDALVPAGLVARTDFASDSLYDILDGTLQESPDTVPDRQPAATPPPRGRAVAAAVLRARHHALAGPEHASDRLVTADELIALSSETGDDELAAVGRGWRVLDLLELGRVEEAAKDRAAHAAIAARLAHAGHRRDAAAWTAMAALLEGRVEEAAAAAEGALVLGTSAGDPEAASAYWAQRWAAALEWGTAEELSEVIDACREQATTAAGTWRASLALLLARTGQLDLAAEELRVALGPGLGQLGRDPGRLPSLTCVAELAWTLGDVRRASLVAPLVEPFAARLAVVGRGLSCLGSVARACGLAAATAHRWDDAERHFDAALTVHRRIGALPLLARTHHEWSEVLAQRGRKADRRRAAESRERAQELARGLGMDRLLP